MKVIGICGSPRPESNTRFYLKQVLSELEALGAETELIQLRELSIRGCKGCYGCVKAKKCIVEDDFGEVFKKMTEADGILFGSPVYHSSISPELKALLDRAGFSGRWYSNEMKEKDESYQWKGTAFSGKVVAPVTVARRAGQNFAFAQILLWAAANDCVIPGATYWNVGVAGKGGAVDAEEDAEGIGIMKHLAGNIVRVIRCLNGGAS
jgi:multimeric flavodoxin WrbA